MKAVALFISTLFAARTQAHVFHLQTKSYAAHKALGAFYDGIVDLADDYVEMAQGTMGIITGYSVPAKLAEEPDAKDLVRYFEMLGSKVKGMENTLPDDCDLENKFADILGLIHSTTYKLKYLS